MSSCKCYGFRQEEITADRADLGEDFTEGLEPELGLMAELAVVNWQEGVVSPGVAFPWCHCCPQGEWEKVWFTGSQVASLHQHVQKRWHHTWADFHKRPGEWTPVYTATHFTHSVNHTHVSPPHRRAFTRPKCLTPDLKKEHQSEDIVGKRINYLLIFCYSVWQNNILCL